MGEMNDYQDGNTESPLIAPLFAPVAVYDVPEPINPSVDGASVSVAITEYISSMPGILQNMSETVSQAILGSAVGNLVSESLKDSKVTKAMDEQIDKLPLSDEWKAFCKKEMPAIARDLCMLALKKGYYSLTLSSGNAANVELDLTSGWLKDMHDTIVKKLVKDLAEDRLSPYVDPLLAPYTEVKVSEAMAEVVKIVFSQLILGNAATPHAFAVALMKYAGKSAGYWAYDKIKDTGFREYATSWWQRESNA